MKNKYILTIAGLLLAMSSLFVACETDELPDDPPKKIPNVPIIKPIEIPTYDTLNFPVTGTPALYELSSPDKGFITGNNSFGDKAKALCFSSYSPYDKLVGFYCWFGYATGNNNTNIEFAAWDKNSSGQPNNKIASKTEKLGTIKTDIAGNYLTFVQFNSPVNISSSFFAGIILPTSVGDTVAIMSNTMGESNPSNTWELNSNSVWGSFNETWTNGKINIYIFPVVTLSSSSTNRISHKEILMPIRINKKITKAKK